MRRELAAATLERQRLQQLAEQREMFRTLLWELAVPLAEALQRLDHSQQLTRSRVQVMQQQQVEMRNQQEQLLLEILQGQQPSAQTQLSPLLGLPPHQMSYPSSVS